MIGASQGPELDVAFNYKARLIKQDVLYVTVSGSPCHWRRKMRRLFSRRDSPPGGLFLRRRLAGGEEEEEEGISKKKDV